MEVVGFCVRPLSLRSNADLSTEPGLPPGGCSPCQSLIVPLASPPERRSRSRWQSARRHDSDHSQPNMLKSGSVSAYAQGAPGSSSLPQPREEVQRQPPPVKICTRRAARAAKSKVKASTPRGCPRTGQPNTTSFWGDREESTSQHTLKLISATQAAASQAEATLPTAYAEPPAAALTSTRILGRPRKEHVNARSPASLVDVHKVQGDL
jgi:hypothetical protein